MTIYNEVVLEIDELHIKEYARMTERIRAYEMFLCKWYKALLSSTPAVTLLSELKVCLIEAVQTIETNAKKLNTLVNSASTSEVDSNSKKDNHKELDLTLQLQELKQNTEKEWKSKQFNLQMQYEEAKLLIQEDVDKVLAKKDMDYNDVINELQNYKQKLVEIEALSFNLTMEREKLVECTNKYKNLMQTHSETKHTLEDCKQQHSKLQVEYEKLKIKQSRDYVEFKQQITLLQDTVANYKKEVAEYSLKNCFCPSFVDIHYLLQELLPNIGSTDKESMDDVNSMQYQLYQWVSSQVHMNANSHTNNSSNNVLHLYNSHEMDHGMQATNSISLYNWKTVECVILKEFHRLSTSAMNYRVEFDTQAVELQRLTQLNKELRDDVQMKSQLINTLEQDIIVAHKTIESGQNIIRNFSQIKDKSKLMLSTIGNSAGNNNPASRNDLQDLFPSNNNVNPDAAPTVYVGQDGASRLLHAITSQRDRYMKLHSEKEETLQVIVCCFMW